MDAQQLHGRSSLRMMIPYRYTLERECHRFNLTWKKSFYQFFVGLASEGLIIMLLAFLVIPQGRTFVAISASYFIFLLIYETGYLIADHASRKERHNNECNVYSAPHWILGVLTRLILVSIALVFIANALLTLFCAMTFVVFCVHAILKGILKTATFISLRVLKLVTPLALVIPFFSSEELFFFGVLIFVFSFYASLEYGLRKLGRDPFWNTVGPTHLALKLIIIVFCVMVLALFSDIPEVIVNIFILYYLLLMGTAILLNFFRSIRRNNQKVQA